ncbi:transposase [Gordonia sp. SW 21]|uniref:Transposase n=1 Tax=Gordonia aquimaris TaxID=2984863 RepID=A0A9X3D7X4_9ACTN|nr:transposase [Gordonia aquimaris]MCX2966753.1 transposase [Gordonia aquimaris]
MRRPLGIMVTGGNINDAAVMTSVLENIRVPRDGKAPRTRPDRVLADKGYPSKANRASLRDRGIAATIPERDDQIAHRRKKPGRPIDFADQQQGRYKGRNVVERCFNRLKQWRGIAMRSDKLLRSYRAASAATERPSTSPQRSTRPRRCSRSSSRSTSASESQPSICVTATGSRVGSLS